MGCAASSSATATDDKAFYAQALASFPPSSSSLPSLPSVRSSWPSSAVSLARPAPASPRPSALQNVPRDMLLVIASFVPEAIPRLVRGSRKLWARFESDALLWSAPLSRMQATRDGRRVLARHAHTILAQWPGLARVLPEPVAQGALNFDISCDQLACAAGTALQVIDVRAAARMSSFSIMLEADAWRLNFSPSGSRLACMGEERIWIYDCASWSLERTLALDDCTWSSLAFVAKDVVVAGAVNGSMVAWGAMTAASAAGLDNAPTCVLGSSSVWSLAGTSSLLASGRESGVVELWDHALGRLLELDAHVGPISDLAFAPDARSLVSAGQDGTVRVWDVASGACAFVHVFNSRRVTAVAVSSAGLLAVALLQANEIVIVRLGEDAAAVNTVHVDKPLRVRFDAAHELFFSQEIYPGYPLSNIAV